MPDLSADERKIYDLIVKRFLALFYPVYEYETVQFKLQAGGKTLAGRTMAVKNAGFTAVLHHEQERENTALLSIKEGKTFKLEQIRLSQHLTEAPKRYSEADILSRMEKYGLGTPATRADIIERLVSSETISRESGRLVPTPKGKQLIDLVNDELKSPELTAKWEEQLEAIARGKGNPKQFWKPSAGKPYASSVKSGRVTKNTAPTI